MTAASQGAFTVSDSDLPSLFCAADQASQAAQKNHLRLVRAQLTFLVLGGVFSALSPAIARTGLINEFFGRPSAISIIQLISALLLLISVGLTFMIRLLRFDRVWYGARAIAESVKTRAWRYMICAEPYIRDLPPKAADIQLSSDISDILSQRKNLSWTLGGEPGARSQITDRMREVRGLDTEGRKETYLSQRIDNQRKWYSSKAAISQRMEIRWFIAVVVSQLIGVAAAMLVAVWPGVVVRPAAAMSVLASAFLAWSQLKRHQESAQAYGVAAHELGLISEKAKYITTEEELSEFVANAESAISREHTLWVARRDAE